MDKSKRTELVIQAQQGSAEAMNELIAGCYERLYALAYQTVKNQDTAYDITQEACLEIMTTLSNLQNPEAFMAWAQKITYHQCTRHFRQSKEILVDENEDGETIFDALPDESQHAQISEAYENKEFRLEMMSIIDSLPPEQRSALLLHYYERLSVKQIAEIQGTNEGTVKSRLNYGRKAVKKQVEAYEKKNNIKLHSVAPLGLLLWWLFQREKEATAVSMQAMPKLAAAVGTAVQAAAATAETAAVATGVSTVASTAATVAIPKIVAGGVAAVVAVGAIGGGVALLSQPEPTEASAPPQSPSSSMVVPSTPAAHIHQFDNGWEYDESQHWQTCLCGETDTPVPHNYTEHQCDCGRYQPSEGLSFSVSNGLAHFTGVGSCTDTVIVIPDSYNGCPVVSIPARAFMNNDTITKVVIPGSILDMGNHIFAYSSVEEVVFLSGVRAIGSLAFMDCYALKSVVIPDTVDTIYDGAFRNCTALESISLPDSIIYVSEGLFEGCSALTSITVPGSFQTLPTSCFRNCTSLTSIVLEEGITSMSDGALLGCSSLTQISLPEGLTTIGANVFENCVSLKQLTLPESLTTLGDYAFQNCARLTAIRIPDAVTVIPIFCFQGCGELSQVTLGSGLRTIGRSAFENCIRLTSLVIPNGVTAFDGWALNNCTGLKELTIPASVTQILYDAFALCQRLERIHYLGTIEQWHAIDIHNTFDRGTGEYIIECTDGTILKKDA